MYPRGFYEFKGAELCLFNGMFASNYGYYGACLLNGHRAVHAPLSLRPGQVLERARGLPMLRASAVLWTRAGEAYPGRVDEYRGWLAQGQDPRNEAMAARREELHTEARALFGSTKAPQRIMLRRSKTPSAKTPSAEQSVGQFEDQEDPFAECHSERFSSPAGVELRLRLRGAGQKKRCKKR